MIDGPQQLTGYRLHNRDHFIATLRQAWLTRGPSQTAIGRRIGLSRTSVSEWLTGNNGTVVAVAFDLAHALGYDLALIPREERP